MVGLCIRLNLCQATPEVQTIEIGKHRGSGRPAKLPIKSALLHETDSYVSQFSTTITTTATLTVITSTNATSNDEIISIANNTVPEVNTSTEPKQPKRGRPPGSKNKAK